MRVYQVMQVLAEAIRDSDVVRDYCTGEFGRGCRVQIDDDREDYIDSSLAPYCLLHTIPGADDSAVTDETAKTFRIEVGTDAGDPPYLAQITERTGSANGLYKYGDGEKAEILLGKVLDVVKNTSLDECTLVRVVTIEVDGILFFPLQIAASRLTVTETNDFSL